MPDRARNRCRHCKHPPVNLRTVFVPRGSPRPRLPRPGTPRCAMASAARRARTGVILPPVRSRSCCSSHCPRIAFMWRCHKQGSAIDALPARPPSHPIAGERSALRDVCCGLALFCPRAHCPRVRQLFDLLLGLPVRLAGNVRPQVQELSAALPERRTALHALRMQLQSARGMELPWSPVSNGRSRRGCGAGGAMRVQRLRRCDAHLWRR